MKKKKVIVTGAAGTVGQNLMFDLEKKYDVVAIDKHEYNLGILKKYHPKIKTVLADLADLGDWKEEFKGADYLITLHAQISDKEKGPFVRNNITATKNVLSVAKKNKIKYLVHFSSSVVISVAKDDYTNTKKKQEKMTVKSGIPHVILRPPLMFGWFDKKHLGWLSRFMAKVPVYPIPGDGKYVRQPLFIHDISKVVMKCLETKPKNKVYNIIGKESVTYIDLMKKIKKAKGLHTLIITIPIPIFSFLLKIYALFTGKPPFTADQLNALVAGDVFPVWDWDKHFGVKVTPLEKALKIAFTGKYSKVVPKP